MRVGVRMRVSVRVSPNPNPNAKQVGAASDRCLPRDGGALARRAQALTLPLALPLTLPLTLTLTLTLTLALALTLTRRIETALDRITHKRALLEPAQLRLCEVRVRGRGRVRGSLA